MDDNKSEMIKFRDLSECYFDSAKSWWGAAWAMKLVTFLFGLPALFWTEFAVYVAPAVMATTLASEACTIRSNNRKSVAESILRKLDHYNSFSWRVSNYEMARLKLLLGAKDRAGLHASEGSDYYFATEESTGWRRAMENLRESAWWSSILAKKLHTLTLSVMIGLFGISLLLLVTSAILVPAGTDLTTASRAAISVLLLLVSLGLLPLAINYHSYSTKSTAAEQAATDLLQEDGDQLVPAIKAWNEYHLARASAPLIPTWLWKRNRGDLNRVWEEYISGR